VAGGFSDYKGRRYVTVHNHLSQTVEWNYRIFKISDDNEKGIIEGIFNGNKICILREE
jgi:hypothetical protein